jgi:hypothetical protein
MVEAKTGDFVEYVNYDEPIIIESYYPASNPNELQLQDIADQEYCYPIKKADCSPLLSIGQMIELLHSIPNAHKLVDVCDSFDSYGGIIINEPVNNLCDALWQAVKQIL